MDEAAETARILARDDLRIDETKANNATALMDILTEDFTYIHSPGFREGRAPYLDRMKTKAVEVKVLARTSGSVRFLSPDVALLEGSSTMTYQLPSQPPGSFDSLILLVWFRARGDWRLAAYASTETKPGA